MSFSLFSEFLAMMSVTTFFSVLSTSTLSIVRGKVIVFDHVSLPLVVCGDIGVVYQHLFSAGFMGLVSHMVWCGGHHDGKVAIF